ncbi:hypothetical protein [Cellulomonas composti]|uniref:Cell division protein FtsL n=1 Tax=Cellulomonas composti TaxID=266130 RepID=A0A511J8C4_9CELL|nr:hypothetical protein [Cellulomonas composti]GEL94247.1 hypothetical protein CCO02nite_09050 [Cellulomonas composti]
MSTATARAYPAPARPVRSSGAPARTTGERAPAPRLRLVRAPANARLRVPFVLVCMGVLALALLTALLLNTQMASNAYAKYDLSNELGRLDQDAKDLSAQLDQKSSPSALAAAAAKLGMVPAAGTGWVRLADGTVQGAPEAP